MSENSSIEWCQHTFNLAWGCIKSSAGCDHCYAEVLAKRYGFDVWGPKKERRTLSASYWEAPLKWNERALTTGVRERVFCSSMTDVFLNDRTIDAEREKLWPLIEATPALDWLLLTKHPERITEFNVPTPSRGYYENVWFGVSVEDNSAAWRVDSLRQKPALIRFLSVEPMLGPIDDVDLAGIDWVIVGGESGPGARPMHPEWVREVRDRCVQAGIALFVKQWGAWQPRRWKGDGATHALGLYPREFHEFGHHPDSRERAPQAPNDGRCWQAFAKMSKAEAGRLLDGREWDEYPRAAVPA